MRVFMRFSYVIMSLILVMMTSCRGRLDKEREVLSSLLGREIIIPDSLECRIQDIPVDYDMNDADYKIITYIDSAGCVPCRMKLSAWKEVINEYNGISNSDIEFLMIINASAKNRDLKIILNQYKFPYRVLFDPRNKFHESNAFSGDDHFHTFLVDCNNHIVAVGNPADNPKVRAFYKKVILNGEEEEKCTPHLCERPVEAFGAVNCGDTVIKQFTLRNNSPDTLTLQGLIPSCDCVNVSASNDTFYPWTTSTVTVRIAIDSIPGTFKKTVDVYYNEKESKECLTLYGFNINKHYY